MRYNPETQTWSGSATDLADHSRCAHLTQLRRHEEREFAEGRAVREQEAPSLVQEKGKDHEIRYIGSRQEAGIELQTQVPLTAGSLSGYADLLERAADGTWEPHEIKFARSVTSEHLLQALMYADALRERDGELPANVYIVDGHGTRHAYRTAEYIHYYERAKERFEAALALDLDTQLEAVPEPAAFCAQCSFATQCAARRAEVDHLAQVARITASQRTQLERAGITTLAQLAESSVDYVPGIGRATLATLRTQARLQDEARTSGTVPIEYRRPAADEPPGRGFALLPEPDAADMFFDFEGYPFHEAGGLEYLWGWTSHDCDGTPTFDYLWASDPGEEAAAFSAFLDVVHARWQASPGMHVYHYAPYEITALRRLAAAHQHEMQRLDELLRAGVFVDLYAVARQAMLIGTESYSIKKLEPLYGRTRAGAELADGGASIEVFEQWLMTRDAQTKQQIIDYNKDDTDSTLELRDWLLEHKRLAQAEGVAWPATAAQGASSDAEAAAAPEAGADTGADERSMEWAERARRLRELAEDATRPDALRLVAELVGAMSGWQWRVRRELYGELFARRIGREADEYIDDADSVAGLELIDIVPDARSQVFRYRFPDQTMIVSRGQKALDAIRMTTCGKVQDIDHEARVLSVRVGPSLLKDPLPVPEVIVGVDDIPLHLLEHAVADVAQTLLDLVDAGRDPFDVRAPHAAAYRMLGRLPTLVAGEPIEAPIDPEPQALAQLIARAHGSHVIVQGPPGTGKTYTSARVIEALVRAGLRVGISSNSHAAIINILRGIDKIDAHGIRAAYALRPDEQGASTLDFGEGWLTRPRNNRGAIDLLEAGDVQLVAGTAWLYATNVELDVVLVDEAGQLSLLHATAIARAARTVVLVGDPQQLAQPSDAKHPAGLEASVLDHLFDGRAVLDRCEAALLDVTYRMRSDIASFISSTYYNGELSAAPENDTQWVRVDGVPRTGIRAHMVEHAGCRVRSDAEVAAIAGLVEDLLARGELVARPGDAPRAVRASDLLIVAPYNAQRVALQSALGAEVRVGTVDSFQGQEAPITIVSMTASSREDLPRGLEFLLDPHRLNVALSRARSLVIVVCSPSLAATSASSIKDMRLLNVLARLG